MPALRGPGGFSRPPAVKRQPGENQQQTDRGSPWPLQPQVYRQGEGTRHENSRYEWITPSAVWPRQIRLFAARAVYGCHGERVENPLREDKQREQVLEL